MAGTATDPAVIFPAQGLVSDVHTAAVHHARTVQIKKGVARARYKLRVLKYKVHE